MNNKNDITMKVILTISLGFIAGTLSLILFYIKDIGDSSKQVISITQDGVGEQCSSKGEGIYLFYKEQKGFYCDNYLNIVNSNNKIIKLEKKYLTTNKLIDAINARESAD